MDSLRYLYAAPLTLLGINAMAQGSNPVASDSQANTAAGTYALYGNFGDKASGYQNTAEGWGALGANNTGYKNAAFGYSALYANTSGEFNTAVGSGSLVSNKTGLDNTALGADALYSLQGGQHNTAVGWQALYAATVYADGGGGASDNTAVGAQALFAAKGPGANTALGYQAMFQNQGTGNIAIGIYSLFGGTNADISSNSIAIGSSSMMQSQNSENNIGIGSASLFNVSGEYNVAVGHYAVEYVSSGGSNVGIGSYSLNSLQTGSSNIALGSHAGYLILGSNNIDIGDQGTKSDNGAIRIGTSGTHKETFIQGIYKVPVTNGAAVFINSAGQLGTVVSSERFKTDIRPISDATKLTDLRPVTYRLKSDPKKRLQYGLIAEEVAKIYPDLVVRDEHGRIDSLRYDELTPLLLYQMQQDRKEIARLREELSGMREAVAQLASSPNGVVAKR
jgi:hypothetical protein